MVAQTCSLRAWEAEKDHEFKVSPGCITRHLLNKNNTVWLQRYHAWSWTKHRGGLEAPIFMLFGAPNNLLSSIKYRESPWDCKAIGRGLALAVTPALPSFPDISNKSLKHE